MRNVEFGRSVCCMLALSSENFCNAYCVRETTVKESHKYGEYGLAGDLLLMCVTVDLVLDEKM